MRWTEFGILKYEEIKIVVIRNCKSLSTFLISHEGLTIDVSTQKKKNMILTSNWKFPLTYIRSTNRYKSVILWAHVKNQARHFFPRIMFIIIMFLFLLEITNKQQVAKKCTKSKSRNRCWRSLEGQIWGRSSQLKKKYPKPCFVV